MTSGPLPSWWVVAATLCSRLGVDPGVAIGVVTGVVAERLGTPCVIEPWNAKKPLINTII